MTTRLQLLDQLRDAQAQFAAVCERLPAQLRERGGACGVWSPRQVVAHLAGWDQEATQRIRVLIADPESSQTYDVNAANAVWVTARSEFDWSETVDDWQKTFGSLMDIVGSVTEAEFCASPGIADWLEGRAEDYRNHAQALTEWAQSEGSHHG